MRGLSYQLDNRRDRAAEPLTCLLFIGLTLFVSPAFAQIYHVQDMNTEQIKALDREKTVVIPPTASSKSTARICRRFRTALITVK